MSAYGRDPLRRNDELKVARIGLMDLRGLNLPAVTNAGLGARTNFWNCAGFADACITKPSSRSRDSAKARNRGPEEARFRRRDLWGFEACERQFSRGRNYERAALWRVARSRGAYAAGIGIRFGVAAAIVRRWRGIIERAPSRLANGQPQEWQERMALRRVDNAISIMRYRSGSRGARRLAGTWF
jgi:hypothetical protein